METPKTKASQSQLSALSKEFVPTSANAGHSQKAAAASSDNQIVLFKNQESYLTKIPQAPKYMYGPNYMHQQQQQRQQQYSYFYCSSGLGGPSGGIWMTLSLTSSQKW
jgi:hypothetical protein